jgi:hypothetical protein
MKACLHYLACLGLMILVPHAIRAQYNLKQKVAIERSKPSSVRVDMSARLVVIGNHTDWDDAAGGGSLELAGSATVMLKQADGTLKLIQKIVSPNRQRQGHFGQTVAVSGDYVAIGAPHETVNGTPWIGAVYIYKWDGSKLNLMSQLLGVKDAGDRDFGYSLAMDGTNLVIGSNYLRYGKPMNGIAYLYTMEKGIWLRKQWLVPTDLDSHSYYGMRVAIDGGTIVVGSDDPALHFHVFTFDGRYWNEQDRVFVPAKVKSIGIDGDYIFYSNEDFRSYLIDLGVVQVYKRTSGSWIHHQTLTASDRANSGWAPSTTGPNFGFSLDVSDGVAVIGAPFDDINETGEDRLVRTGSAYVFRLEADGFWRQHQKVTADRRGGEARFGWSVATSAGLVMASDLMGSSGVYLFTKASYPSSSCAITKVRIFPKPGCTTCLVGGQVQVSNVGTTGPWTTIFNVPSQTAGRWNDYVIPSSPADYKAVRYVGAFGSHCGVAEIEFYKGAAKLTGALFHDGGGAWEAGSWDFAKAFDGKTDTYYYGRNLSGYIGIQTSCAGVKKSAFAPDSTFADNAEAAGNAATEVIFPNPLIGGERLQITSSRKEVIRAITIYDRNGKVKLTSQRPTDIDVSGLLPGKYSVQIMYTDGQVGSHHIIKK